MRTYINDNYRIYETTQFNDPDDSYFPMDNEIDEMLQEIKDDYGL